ncbi:MAG: hypothetical protein ACPL28_08545 [bacterium]
MDTKFDTKTKREIGEYLFIDKYGIINAMAKDIDRKGNRIYTLREIKYFLHKAGLSFVNAYAGYELPPKKFTKSLNPPCIVIITIK